MITKCGNHKYFRRVDGKLLCDVCGQPPEGAIEDKAQAPAESKGHIVDPPKARLHGGWPLGRKRR